MISDPNTYIMKQVLVFKTSVVTLNDVKSIEPLLNNLLAKTDRWNFDLEDCDKILRIEAEFVQPYLVIENLSRIGVSCSELES